MARPDPWTKFRQDAVTILGLATGYGLDDNVLAAYDFLIRHYEEGDDIYFFGFSRGAYSVRILAGLIHKVGLLSPQQNNLAGAALTAYKQFSSIAGQQEDQVSDGDDEHGESSSPTRDDRSFPIRTDRLDKVADDQIRRCLGYRCKRYRAEAR